MTAMELDLILQLDTAILIGSDFSRGRVHKLMVRDHNGNPIIPATTLKGRLRYYLGLFEQQLRTFMPQLPTNLIDTLLGGPNLPGCLFFDSIALTVPDLEQRSGIMVNRMLGSVEANFLRTMETSVAGQTLKTRIEGHFPDGAPHDDLLCLLLGALRLFDKLGSNKSAGLGTVSVTVEKLSLGGKVIEAEAKLTHYLNRQLLEVRS